MLRQKKLKMKKMKKWNIFLAALIALIAFFSCTDEEREPIIDVVDGEYSEVTFSMQMPTPIKPFKTYAATEEDENRIEELDILAFAKKTGGVDTLAYRITLSASEIVDATNGGSGNKKKIKAKLKRHETPLKFVFIANASSLLDNVNMRNGDEKEQLLKQLVSGFTGKWSTSPMQVFPMWGQTSDFINLNTPTVITPIDVVLLRSVVKVDIGVDVEGDPAVGFGARFKLKHVYVYNAKNKVAVVPGFSNFDQLSNRVNQPTIPEGTGAISEFQEYDVSGTTFFNEIYLPESDKNTSNHTCLVVGGSYDEGPETYYRIDFVDKNDENLHLLRNHRFLVNITNVAREGFSTKEEALAAKTSHIEYSLDVVDENITSIVYNGQYMLGVEEDNVLLDWPASTGNTITVVTDYPGGWTATTDVSWITLTSVPGSSGASLVYDVDRNLEEKLRRTGKITVTAGTLVQEIEVTQYLGSNSYVIFRNQILHIPLISANADGVERITNGMNLSAEVLWQDTIGVIDNVIINGVGPTKENLLTVRVGDNIGNALIALKNNGETLWSWHVWYAASSKIPEVEYNGTVFMNRDLGSIIDVKYTRRDPGLVYQWGRKDPFPGSLSVNENEKPIPIINMNNDTVYIRNEKVTAASNFENSIKNPMTFYTSDEYPWYSWYGLSETNNSLWVDSEGKKTAYDPCPFGWRVPASPSVWDGAAPTYWYGGYSDPVIGYYNASGIFDFATGKLSETGITGYCWTAEPAGTKARALRFNRLEFSNKSTLLRGNGVPVRCVKE